MQSEALKLRMGGPKRQFSQFAQVYIQPSTANLQDFISR